MEFYDTQNATKMWNHVLYNLFLKVTRQQLLHLWILIKVVFNIRSILLTRFEILNERNMLSIFDD